jgi:hypothetical protein
MTTDRIVEFQRAALVAQQNHLDAALLKLRTAQTEIDLQTEHNRTLFALLLQRDRQLAAVRAELQQVRDLLADAPSITEGGFAG